MRLLSQESTAHRDDLGKAILTLNPNSHTGQDMPLPLPQFDGAGSSGMATPVSAGSKLKINFGVGGGTSTGMSADVSDGEEGELDE